MKKITHLAPAEREEQLRRHGLDPSARWSGIEGADRTQDAVAGEFLREGGWTLIDPMHAGRESGMVAHRGTLHPVEHVNHERLVGLVENELGFSLDAMHSVYSRKGGPLAGTLRALRARIDARLLELSQAGANMDELSRVTGVAPRTLDNALARARAVEATS